MKRKICISKSPYVGSSNKLATCRDCYFSMCSAGKPKSCVSKNLIWIAVLTGYYI